MVPDVRHFSPRPCLFSTWTHCEYQLIGDVRGSQRAHCLMRLLSIFQAWEWLRTGVNCPTNDISFAELKDCSFSFCFNFEAAPTCKPWKLS